MVVAPAWLAFDVISKKNSLFLFYRGAELFLQKKWVMIIAILLVLSNWIWNICKGI